MANRVTTIFDAVDKGLSDAVNRIKVAMAGADTASGKFKAGLSGLMTELRNSREAQAAVATGAVAIGVASVKAASDLGESMNAVDVTFGRAAEGIHELGEESANAYGMSERAFNQFATQFSAFATQISKESGQSIVSVVDEMTTRVADFASVHNLSMEEAGRVAQSTLAGETEAFRRYGGDVSAATVTTYAYEKGIADAGEQLTEQQKILARYGLFMEQTDKTAGDFKNTQDSMANAMRTAEANLENLAAKFGSYLTPAIADSLTAVNDFTDALGEIDAQVGKVTGSGLADWFSKIANNTGPLGAIRRMGDALEYVRGRFQELSRYVDFGKKDLDAFGAAQGEMANIIWKSSDAFDAHASAAEAAYDELGRLNQETYNVSDAQSIVQGYIDDATDAMEEQNEAARDLRHELRELTERTTDLYDAELDLEESIKGANEVLADEETTLRKARAAMREVATDMDSVISKQVEMSGLTLDSVAGQEAWVIGMLQSAETLDGPLRDAVLGYISEVSGIPKEVLTQYRPEMDYAALAAIEADLAYAARTRFVRFAPSGTQGGAVIDGPNTGPRGATPNDPLGWAAAAAGPPVTNIYNAVSVNAIDPGTLLYDLDRMAKGLG